MQRTQPIRWILPRKIDGFTLVEVLTVVVVLGLVFPIFSVLFVNMYHDTVYFKDRITMSSMMNQALAYIDESARESSEFLTSVPSEFVDTYGPHGLGTAGLEAWSYKGDSSSSRVLITKSYATTTNPLNTGRTPVFINTPSFNCTTEIYYQPELSYITVYFVSNQTLYRRLLTDTTTPLCAGNTPQQKKTCPATIAIAARAGGCEANDETLMTQVAHFSVAYYQSSQDGTGTQIDADYSSSDPEILSSADYIILSISLSSHGGAVHHTMTQRIAKLNQ